jgi:glucose/mannose-6-phosphate isomerase
VIHGCGLTEAVALRWKTQLNENAKAPAFASRLPEADHNEIAGWEGAGESGRFSAVFLEDSDQHPRERERIELTAKLIEPHAARVVRVETDGETRTERLLQAVMLGDLVSLHFAANRGVDPSKIAAIDALKEQLGHG